jgi:hypothetical protein
MIFDLLTRHVFLYWEGICLLKRNVKNKIPALRRIE